jgi:HEAT repeat protein
MVASVLRMVLIQSTVLPDFECNGDITSAIRKASLLSGTSTHSVVSKLLQMKRQTVLHTHLILLTLILLFVLIPSTVAQQTPEVQVGSVTLYRFGDLLREHNIDLTEPALVRALKNPDSEVRFLAAMKLAEDKAVDAIPAVKQAMAAEKTPRTRVNIAVALGLLGDPGGRDELEEVCADGDFPPEFRLYAVRYMFDLGVERDEDCLHAAEEIVQVVDSENRTVADRDSALELLPRFRNLMADESKKIFQLVVDRLHDPEPTVRMAASQSLASLGNAAAIPYLEAGIAREQEEGTRSVLELNLKKLQTKAEN